MCFSSSGSNSGNQARADELARQGRIKDGRNRINSAFSGFNPSFYGERRGAFMDYGMPQLEQSFQGAQRATMNNLARRGLLNSSAGARSIGNLTRERASALGNLNGEADSFVNRLRGDVENQRQNVTGILQASADPAAAANLAQQTAGTLNNRPAFAPIGSSLANLTALAAANSNSVSSGNPSIFRRSGGGIYGGSGNSLNIVN